MTDSSTCRTTTMALADHRGSRCSDAIYGSVERAVADNSGESRVDGGKLTLIVAPGYQLETRKSHSIKHFIVRFRWRKACFW
jgi:hypothetical protein